MNYWPSVSWYTAKCVFENNLNCQGKRFKEKVRVGGERFFLARKKSQLQRKQNQGFVQNNIHQTIHKYTHNTIQEVHAQKPTHAATWSHAHTTPTRTHTKMIHYMHKYITCADMQGWIYGTHAPLKPYLYNTLRVCHVTLYRTSHHWIPNIDNGNFLSFLKIVSNSALSSRPLSFLLKNKNKKATCQINTLRRSPTSFLLILIYKRQSLTSCQGCWDSPYK